MDYVVNRSIAIQAYSQNSEVKSTDVKNLDYDSDAYCLDKRLLQRLKGLQQITVFSKNNPKIKDNVEAQNKVDFLKFLLETQKENALIAQAKLDPQNLLTLLI